MSKRLEIEFADNGFMVTTWGGENSTEDEYGYREPEKLVAESSEKVLEIVEKFLKEGEK